MSQPAVQTLILAGGAGERFWPLSRKDRPKQVLALAGEVSLVRQALERALHVSSAEGVWILTSAHLVEAIQRELPEVPEDHFVGEPVGRNTAPAIAFGCHLVTQTNPDAVVLVLPSDHWIPETEIFREDVERAVDVARRTQGLVTFGIPPVRPETGYGYVEKGEALPDVPGAHRVLRFHEKPDVEKAKAYKASGRHFWNSGIFVWRASKLLEEMRRYQPSITDALPPAGEIGVGPRRAEILATFYNAVPSISVDYGVMEKSQDVFMVEARFPWSDLGTWEAWGETRTPDAHGNRTEGDVLVRDGCANIVYSETGGRVALLGVSSLVVVRTGDVTLVIPRERIQEVRDLVQRMREENDEDPYL